ncbi:uncharacterized protein JCM6883_001214 [Sporobolomyces salmoneus]|uniref:uncharacterized protein n=1 Tax=Sporobolomyces salmoneus TaxID=183962 RepID=UPI00317B38D4
MDWAWGSRGTKGTGWAQRGVLIDWIGQVSTPSKFHLLALDALIALFQLLTLLVSFAITLPSDLDASTTTTGATGTRSVTVLDQEGVQVTVTAESTAHTPLAEAGTNGEEASEAARDYFGLLGLHEEDEFNEEDGFDEFELASEEEEDEEVTTRRRKGKRKRGYESISGHTDDGEFALSEDYDEDSLYGPSSPRSITSAIPTRERIPLKPIAKLRFRHIWNEIKPGSFRNSFERVQEEGLRVQEEGRIGGRGRARGES